MESDPEFICALFVIRVTQMRNAYYMELCWVNEACVGAVKPETVMSSWAPPGTSGVPSGKSFRPITFVPSIKADTPAIEPGVDFILLNTVIGLCDEHLLYSIKCC